jgi:hypothetical protein
MAYAVQLTIGTGQTISLNAQSQDVSVSLTYQMEREDADVLAVVEEKAREVAKAHRVASDFLKGVKAPGKAFGADDGAAPMQRSAPQENVAAPGSGRAPDVGERDGTATEAQISALQALLARAIWGEERVREHLETHFGCSDLASLTREQCNAWLLELQRTLREQARTRRTQPQWRAPARPNGQNGPPRAA